MGRRDEVRSKLRTIDVPCGQVQERLAAELI